MKILVTNDAPCKLEKGHARRVPQNPRSWVVGYHLCCPRCGFVTIAFNGRDGLTITENNTDEASFSCPLRCLYCQVLIHLKDSELTMEEDENVRPIRFR